MLSDSLPMPLEYTKAHTVCPSCGEERYAKKVKDPKIEGGKYLEDLGEIHCLKCDWTGIGHDLVPVGSVQRIGPRQTVYQVYRLVERAQGDIAGEIRVMLGEQPLPSTAFSAASVNRRVRALMACADDDTNDEDRHAMWMQMHVDAGWVYGEQFDEPTRTHPNMKPWKDLSPAVRAKARVFAHMAVLARDIVELFR